MPPERARRNLLEVACKAHGMAIYTMHAAKDAYPCGLRDFGHIKNQFLQGTHRSSI